MPLAVLWCEVYMRLLPSCSRAMSRRPLVSTRSASSVLPVSLAGAAALDLRSSMGSGTQLASIASMVLRVTSGVSLLVKKAGRWLAVAGAYAEVRRNCSPLILHRIEQMRPSRSLECDVVMRVVAASRVSLGSSSMLFSGRRMPVPVPFSCVLVAGLWLAIHRKPERAAFVLQAA